LASAESEESIVEVTASSKSRAIDTNSSREVVVLGRSTLVTDLIDIIEGKSIAATANRKEAILECATAYACRTADTTRLGEIVVLNIALASVAHVVEII
jgi:hypothetical protein